MQKALNYGKNQEEYLKRFLEDGYVPMHNSGSERCIIPLCVGINNWKAIDSEDGAIAAAYAYSIAETAKANQADPFYYYKFLIGKTPIPLKRAWNGRKPKLSGVSYAVDRKLQSLRTAGERERPA